MKNIFLTVLTLVAFSTLNTGTSSAHSSADNDNNSDPWTKTLQIAENIYVIESKMGGNITVAVDGQSVILVDDQLKDKSAEVIKAVKAISDKPIKFIVTTHYHFDHSGGNESFTKEEGANIVAHDNVRKILKQGTRIDFFNKDVPAENHHGLPVLTFNDEIKLYQANDEEIEVIHVKNAHTDGDSIVFFKKANVISTGDILFNGMFPFVDVAHGGSVTGTAKALRMLAGLGDENTKFVPGHGVITDRSVLTKTADMLDDFYNTVNENNDKDIAQLMKNEKLKSYGDVYGNGVVNFEGFLKIVLSEINKH